MPERFYILREIIHLLQTEILHGVLNEIKRCGSLAYLLFGRQFMKKMEILFTFFNLKFISIAFVS